MTLYDIIVVGGRCAGASAAMLAARAGHRVLLLDRARMPSDTVSTHLVHQPGVALLAEWGVLDAVVATGCPAITQSAYHVADVHLHGSSMASGGQHAAYAPRRYLLDEVLLSAAVAAGVEFRSQATVTGLLLDEHGVCGVRYRTQSGQVHEERGRLVVGADGMRSAVARFAGAPTVVEDPTLTCVYYSYWSGLPPRFELFEDTDRFAGTVPTNDELSVVSIYFPQPEFEAVRRDARRIYVDNVARMVPGLRDATVTDDRFGKLHAVGDQRNFFRQGTGPGWLLLGDAWHHKDSITARGISDAFLQADMFGRQVVPHVADPVALAGALADYEAMRKEKLTESYRNTLSVARLDIQQERIQLLKFIERDPQLVDRYFSVVSGTLSVDEVYSPELLSGAARGRGMVTDD
ncbi:flavin-dependent dehydrogenase [Kutzneria viridogrisea]|uniref:Flavin-dependent dehydrogenase n=1 Tax=Kutzneria viridogrisea TaxID=47990 RepID=A0ABR6BQE6_9PSEU|nr:flavin-dependent dehydrogenase [Kutzneria viridogrisea]